jgi:hypothetical protein
MVARAVDAVVAKTTKPSTNANRFTFESPQVGSKDKD